VFGKNNRYNNAFQMEGTSENTMGLDFGGFSGVFIDFGGFYAFIGFYNRNGFISDGFEPGNPNKYAHA